jgi:3-oxo-4-pregnene-20-carboxyl-CoA dehydrogenase alpha subunit
VELTRTPSSGGEPEYTLRMDHAHVEGVLGGRIASGICTSWPPRGPCALAARAVAGALAEFQAVSQQIADVYIASRALHLAALAACWRLDASADLGAAGYWCAEQAPRSVRICHHLHGGPGMDLTYPLHRFSSLAADLVRYLGGTEYRLACSST